MLTNRLRPPGFLVNCETGKEKKIILFKIFLFKIFFGLDSHKSKPTIHAHGFTHPRPSQDSLVSEVVPAQLHLNIHEEK